MLDAFVQYLKSTCRCSLDQVFLLAVSGGIDSVVMTDLFHRAGLQFAIAHCNFQLRGKESDADQRFVEELAACLHVPFFIRYFDTGSYAAREGISIQMAARDLRYEWFETLRKEKGYAYVATGHNKNDMVETALLNFSRGSGIRGLSGIKSRSGNLIRPLLFASRRDIENYAYSQGMCWRDDSSNNEIKYTRNKIRHHIIPEFEAINPVFLERASDTISHLAQINQLLDHVIAGIRKEVMSGKPSKYLIEIEKLMAYPAIETILFELLREFGCNETNARSVAGIINALPGKQVMTPTHVITRDRTYLIITDNVLYEDAEYAVERLPALIEFPFLISFNLSHIHKDFTIPPENRIALLDADKISLPLILRRWKPGDAFQPLGMNGTKKVSDFLIDNKIPLPEKSDTWVVESGKNIAWIVGHRIDNRFKITPMTKNILVIEYKKEAMENL
jgi:tRNA(Ile)-lysidine synthase